MNKHEHIIYNKFFLFCLFRSNSKVKDPHTKKSFKMVIKINLIAKTINWYLFFYFFILKEYYGL